MPESFKELQAWQRAIQMTLAIYQCTSHFPNTERFGLATQLRRAAVSVPSNIAEGYGRQSRGEYLQFLGHARGSICEVETQLHIARCLEMAPPESFDRAEQLCNECGKMLTVMAQKLRQTT